MTRVGKPILAKHYSQKQRDKDRMHAKKLGEAMEGIAIVRHHTEDGVPLNTFEAAALHTSETEVIQKYGRLYTLQIIRFLAYLLSDIAPYLSDYFRIFMHPQDAYLKRHRAWSIYEL